MEILRMFPEVVGATSTVAQRFAAVTRERGLDRKRTDDLLSVIPFTFLNAPCFFDRLIRLWRYEYGTPLDRLPDDQQVWGAHMWIPVDYLFNTVFCAFVRLPASQRRQYLARLVDRDKHQDALAEFAPVLHLNPDFKAAFEVPGLGSGNRTIDWVIQATQERQVLLDVKRRTRDFIEYVRRIIGGARDSEGKAPAPTHEPALLFRNVEEKFMPRDPDTYLQGAWIVTDLQQEAGELAAAFEALDARRIHFAILGDWEEGVHVLVRRPVDKPFLLTLLGVSGSPRFVFRRGVR